MSINLNKNQLRTALEVPPYYKLTPKFTIYKKDTTVYAMDEDGNVPYSGSDAAAVIQSAINALTPGRTWLETIVLKGDLDIGSSIDLTNSSYARIVITGRLRATAAIDVFKINSTDHDVYGIVIEGYGEGTIDGNNITGAKAVNFNFDASYFGHRSLFRYIRIRNFPDANAFYLYHVNGSKIEWVYITDSGQPGMYLNNCWDDWIRDVRTPGVTFYYCGNSFVSDVYCSGVGSGATAAFYMSGSRYMWLTNIYIEYVYTKGLRIENAYDIDFSNLEILKPRTTLIDAISIYNSYNLMFKNVQIRKTDYGTNNWRYGIVESGTGSVNNVFDGILINDCDTPISRAGNVSYWRNLVINDKRCENSGTATILSGQTSVTVTHDLYSTPSRVIVTPRGNVGSVWVSARDATSFTINCSTAPGADTVVDWWASVY
jgi:hypothetical protein